MRISDWSSDVCSSDLEMIHYGFSKAAQLAIARGAAELTRGSRVTVNSVLPGPTWVEAQAGRVAARASAIGITPDEFKRRTFTERRPSSLLQRYAEADEVASLICYLCSPAASATKDRKSTRLNSRH